MEGKDKYVGWVKVHRKILKHWIVSDPYYFSAWIMILLEVNHDFDPVKVVISKRVIECGRGQSVKSVDTWATVFGSKYWTRQKVRTFFQLLEKDGMINQENLVVTTRLSVCNFDTYQARQPTDNQQSNHPITTGQPPDNHRITTNKNGKNGKNGKNEENIPPNPLEGGSGCAPQREEPKSEAFSLDATQPKAKMERFIPPELYHMQEYASVIGLPSIEAEKAFDFYTSKGWIIGRSKMKDWKASLRNWKRNIEERSGKTSGVNGSKPYNPSEDPDVIRSEIEIARLRALDAQRKQQEN
jgi:hypothetical protein